MSDYHWLPKLLFGIAAIFTFVMAVLPRPPKLPGNPSDKVQHALAFATLGLLAVWAYPETSPLRLVILLSLFGALIELVHMIPALRRNSDWADLVVDIVAAGLVIALISWLR